MSTESTKTIKGRISNKHGTEEYWILSVYNSTTDLTDSNKRANPFIPLPGELIIYDPDDLHPYYRFKFGDNEEDETKRKNVVELPFVLSDNLGEPQLKYKTELLKAGNSQVKVELPLDAVITGVEVRDTSGAIVITDSVVTKGSSKSVSYNVITEPGEYEIHLREGSQGNNIGCIIHGYDICLDGDSQGGPEDIDLPAPDESGIIRVHLDEEIRMEYPEYGSQEDDYYYEYYQIYIEDDSAIDSILKVTYPSVSISISEPINEDLEITILYQE